jgi:hypothetical protein
MCEIKSRSHPKIKQNYKMLVSKLDDIARAMGYHVDFLKE